MSTGKITALVCCQVQGCAEEVSYQLDMVRMYKEAPICEECYNEDFHVAEDVEADVEQTVDWGDLPLIGLEDLCK